eukprot:TRINITY_DN386_c1_g1_i1.p1 TRINITY_DN386_c1_g1~~TRINITY_DN386_c1_g1_i1.p1  ORF type:complete len:202 (+),score=65.75 TRINITY_DN386_c1_g1_i1:67-672(+)
MEYGRVVAGKLNLRGGDLKKKKKRRKRKRTREEIESESEEEPQTLRKMIGSGKILTSGTVVMGYETKFDEELANGDAIQIRNPTTLVEETRLITAVLSNVSISLSTPFSTDVITRSSFHYFKKPKEKLSKEEKTKRRKSEKKKHNTEAFGTYSDVDTVTFRVKSKSAYGGYTIVKQKTGGELTRSELLEKRVGMKADRHCY